MSYARKSGKWRKWESSGNGKIETLPKINGDQWGNTFKKPKKKIMCNEKTQTKHRQERTCTHEGNTILIINLSFTGWEQHDWELLGGAAERVTQSVSGTKASYCANKGKACCIAISLARLRLVPLGNLMPSTSRQRDNMVLDQSCSLPLCAAITNFACILTTTCPLFGLCGVANSSALLFSPSSQTSSATFTAASVQRHGSAEKHAWQTKHVFHQMRNECLHVAHSIPLRIVKKSWLPSCVSRVPSGATTVTTSTLCRSASFPDRAFAASGVSNPPKMGTMPPSSATASLPCRHCTIVASKDSRASYCRETLSRGHTSKRA